MRSSVCGIIWLCLSRCPGFVDIFCMRNLWFAVVMRTNFTSEILCAQWKQNVCVCVCVYIYIKHTYIYKTPPHTVYFLCVLYIVCVLYLFIKTIYIYIYIYIYETHTHTHTHTVSFLPSEDMWKREREQGISLPSLNVCRPPLRSPWIFKHRTVTLHVRHQVCIDLLRRVDNRKEFQVCWSCVTS